VTVTLERAAAALLQQQRPLAQAARVAAAGAHAQVQARLAAVEGAQMPLAEMTSTP
jgi:hypothetical protein